MRQEILAGARAGLVAALPLASLVDAISIYAVGQTLFAQFHSYTVLPNGMTFPLVLVMIAVSPCELRSMLTYLSDLGSEESFSFVFRCLDWVFSDSFATVVGSFSSACVCSDSFTSVMGALTSMTTGPGPSS